MWIGSPDLLSNIGRHVLASAFSGENLLLALDQADYFLSAEAPSPLQHFWSLAVEEQFYIVWPLVVLLVVAITRKFSQRVRALTGVIVTIVVASAAFAIFLTAVNEPSGYYNSLARAWELGLGAFVAILGARGTSRDSDQPHRLGPSARHLRNPQPRSRCPELGSRTRGHSYRRRHRDGESPTGNRDQRRCANRSKRRALGR
jgi:peptidoglycan/LPS O-acetylase OafA/YrhL